MPPAVPARRPVVVALAAVLVVVGLASPAVAHPYFHDGQAPARSLATVTLDLAHGCTAGGGHAHGDGEVATTAVAMELPDAVTFVAPHPVDGWDVTVEREGERPTAVTWAAEGGATPAPAFDLDLVIGGDEGDEVWFRVVQGCDDTVHRWFGTPDDPADEPAVSLVLTAPDPDRAPPDPDEASVTEEGATAAPEEEDATVTPEDDDPATDEERGVDDGDGTGAEEPAAAPDDDGGGAALAVLGAIGLVMLGAAVTWWARRRATGP